MLVYRIGHKNYATRLAASGADGRWAAAGRMVIYAAESIALALLENMVRRQGVGFNNDFKTVIIEVPDNLAVKTILPEDLSKNWRSFKDYGICQSIGNQWYDAADTPILKAPSAILPPSYNFVLNTHHPDFKHIRIVAITDLAPDERIEDILKNYKKG